MSLVAQRVLQRHRHDSDSASRESNLQVAVAKQFATSTTWKNVDRQNPLLRCETPCIASQ
jgi:hypothetical protein